ncbi:MAG: hypothetical protein KAW87_07075, partial [Candidatus Cloacimonetes bacterium]|nr:hypothetical protein [Candidatus Cloacimonadota bacterium]
IYNIKGQLVRQFKLQKAKGKNYIEWDGKDENGKPVPGGIYLLKLEIDGMEAETKKCLLIR